MLFRSCNFTKSITNFFSCSDSQVFICARVSHPVPKKGCVGGQQSTALQRSTCNHCVREAVLLYFPRNLYLTLYCLQSVQLCILLWTVRSGLWSIRCWCCRGHHPGCSTGRGTRVAPKLVGSISHRNARRLTSHQQRCLASRMQHNQPARPREGPLSTRQRRLLLPPWHWDGAGASRRWVPATTRVHDAQHAMTHPFPVTRWHTSPRGQGAAPPPVQPRPGRAPATVRGRGCAWCRPAVRADAQQWAWPLPCSGSSKKTRPEVRKCSGWAVKGVGSCMEPVQVWRSVFFPRSLKISRKDTVMKIEE